MTKKFNKTSFAGTKISILLMGVILLIGLTACNSQPRSEKFIENNSSSESKSSPDIKSSPDAKLSTEVNSSKDKSGEAKPDEAKPSEAKSSNESKSISDETKSFNDKLFASEGLLSPNGKYKFCFFQAGYNNAYFIIRTMDNSRPDFNVPAHALNSKWNEKNQIVYLDQDANDKENVIDIEEKYKEYIKRNK